MESPNKESFWKKHKTLILNLTAIIIVVIIIIVLLAEKAFISSKGSRMHYSGAILTENYKCASIGRSLINKGAHAVDAAIGCQICDSALNGQHLRGGEGFIMNIYKRETKESVVVASTELGSEDGLGTRSYQSKHFDGLWDAHRRYGKLSWETLIEPTIRLCNRGHFVSNNLEKVLKENENAIFDTPYLRKSYIDPSTNQTYSYGRRIKQTQLAKSLQVQTRARAFGGSNITRQFRGHRPNYVTPLSSKILKNYTLRTVGAPGSGAILLFILNVLDELLNDTNFYIATYWQRLAEVFKFAYAKRAEIDRQTSLHKIQEETGKLISDEFADEIRMRIRDDYTSSDPKYYGIDNQVNEDYDIRSVVVYTPNGDAVVISYVLSKKIVKDSSKTDAAASEDISKRTPQSPISFMCPSIILDQNGNAVLVIGGGGSGFTYLTSIVQVILRRLWYKQNLHNAIHEARMYQEFFPLQLKFDENFDKKLIEELVKIGHKVDYSPTKPSTIGAVGREYQVAEYYFDRRGEGGEIVLN